jgi:hypothetical protein
VGEDLGNRLGIGQERDERERGLAGGADQRVVRRWDSSGRFVRDTALNVPLGFASPFGPGKVLAVRRTDRVEIVVYGLAPKKSVFVTEGASSSVHLEQARGRQEGSPVPHTSWSFDGRPQ